MVTKEDYHKKNSEILKNYEVSLGVERQNFRKHTDKLDKVYTYTQCIHK